jgi:protoporphyrinogen oxidase
MTRPTDSSPVVVLGAGLTGMSAGYHLAARGIGYRIFERAPFVGGHAITIEDEGYRFDRTGHLLHLRDDAMRELVRTWVGGDWLMLDRRSMVFSHGVYTRYPFQANTFGLPPRVAFECLQGFLSAHFAKDKPEPTNFEEFCLSHFGEGISRHFMLPYNERLWGVPAREITADWCARFVPRPKLEDVVAGAVGLNDRELGYNAKFWYPRLGIGQLAKGLASAIEPGAARGIELGRSPRRIDWRARVTHVDDERIPYDALISTIPLPTLLAILVDVPERVREAAGRLRCTHVYYLDVALNEPVGRPWHWVYVPEAKYPFYRVGCYSNFSAALAPVGASSLYVELADRAEPELGELLPRVADGLVELGLIAHPRAIRFARLRRIDYAYVVFDRHYFAALETIRAFLAGANILSVGRYGGWNYSSMEDALIFGRDAASEVERALSGSVG